MKILIVLKFCQKFQIKAFFGKFSCIPIDNSCEYFLGKRIPHFISPILKNPLLVLNLSM